MLSTLCRTRRCKRQQSIHLSTKVPSFRPSCQWTYKFSLQPWYGIPWLTLCCRSITLPSTHSTGRVQLHTSDFTSQTRPDQTLISAVRLLDAPQPTQSSIHRRQTTRTVSPVGHSVSTILKRIHAIDPSPFRSDTYQPTRFLPVNWLPSHPPTTSNHSSPRSSQQAKMCTRIIHQYSCGHRSDTDYAPCASSRTLGRLCSASEMKSRIVKHDEKCDNCDG